MLDDLKLIHEKDGQDALGIAEKQAQQLMHEFDITPKLQVEDAHNIVYAGMGGSALAAQLATSWPAFSIPFELIRNYTIPSYIGSSTLFIAASYSGNTEETLSALEQAEKQGAKIAVIAGGGKLAEIAKQKGYPIAILPPTSQPRYAVFYNFKALLTLLVEASIIKKEEVDSQLSKASSFLNEQIKAWLPTVPTANNQAKQIAQELMGKSIVIYAGPLLFPAAYKWKISFNENAKHIAWCNQLPEFNHNEMLGWTEQPSQKPYAVIDLLSSLDHPRVKKRFEVTERLLSGKRPAPISVQSTGETALEQLVWIIALGDFVSLYLALLNNLNPTPVELIEKFKKALDE